MPDGIPYWTRPRHTRSSNKSITLLISRSDHLLALGFFSKTSSHSFQRHRVFLDIEGFNLRHFVCFRSCSPTDARIKARQNFPRSLCDCVLINRGSDSGTWSRNYGLFLITRTKMLDEKFEQSQTSSNIVHHVWWCCSYGSCCVQQCLMFDQHVWSV